MKDIIAVKDVEKDVTAWFRKNWFVTHANHEFKEDSRGRVHWVPRPPRTAVGPRSNPHGDWSYRPRKERT
jgi:hypothetical protein